MSEEHTCLHIKPLESGANWVSEVDSEKVALNIQEGNNVLDDTPSSEESSKISPFSESMEQPAPAVEGICQLECYDVLVAGVSFTPTKLD